MANFAKCRHALGETMARGASREIFMRRATASASCRFRDKNSRLGSLCLVHVRPSPSGANIQSGTGVRPFSGQLERCTVVRASEALGAGAAMTVLSVQAPFASGDGFSGDDAAFYRELDNVLDRGSFHEAAKLASSFIRADGVLQDRTVRRIMQGLVSRREYHESARLFELYRRSSDSIGYSTFHFATVAYANLGRVRDLDLTLSFMQDLGYKPNRSTLTSAISGLCRLAKGRKGVSVAERAHRLWEELRDGEEGADAAGVRAGVSACVAAGRIEEARAIIERVAKDRPDWLEATIFNRLIPGLVTSGKESDLDDFTKWMMSFNVSPSEATWNSLIDAAVETGGAAKGETVARQALERGADIGLWGWNSLMKGYMREGDLKAAEEVLQRMQEAGVRPNHVSYGTLMEACAKAGDAGRCAKVASSAMAAGIKLTAREWNILVRVQASAGGSGIDAAFDTMAKMVQSRVKPTAVTYNTLMAACSADGDYTSVLKLFDALVDSGTQPDSVSYTLLVTAHAGRGDMDAAEDALHEMLETPGVSADAMAFCVLVDGYASRHGGTAAAEGVVNELLDRHATGQIQGEVSEWGLPAFGALMKGYRRDKDVTGAFGALQRMVEAGVVPDMAAIGGLLDVCIMTGRWKHAIGVVEAMLAAGMSPQQASQCRQLLRWLKEGERVAREKLYGRPTEAPEVERIKFWLGLPNQYYGDTNWP